MTRPFRILRNVFVLGALGFVLAVVVANVRSHYIREDLYTSEHNIYVLGKCFLAYRAEHGHYPRLVSPRRSHLSYPFLGSATPYLPSLLPYLVRSDINKPELRQSLGSDAWGRVLAVEIDERENIGIASPGHNGVWCPDRLVAPGYESGSSADHNVAWVNGEFVFQETWREYETILFASPSAPAPPHSE